MTSPAFLSLSLLGLLAAGAALGARPAPQDPAPDAAADRVHLLVSGSMLGRLEPCGCASGQLGGLPRRMQHIGEQRGYDVMIEGGDLVAEASELDLQKAITAMTVLFGMQRPYDALGVGSKDLRLPYGEWSAFASTTPLIATDLVSKAADWPAKPFVEKVVRNQKVRLVSFTMQLPPELQKPDAPLRVLPPAEAWQKGLAGADPATLRVLLLHTDDAHARQLAPTLEPKPDLVVCFDEGYTEPAAHPELAGAVPIVYPGTRGRVLVDVSLTRLPDGPRVGTALVPLQGSRTVPGGGGDPDVKEVLRNHRSQVKDFDVLTHMANRRPTGNGASYVGNAACALCHASADAAWQKSRHAHAWQTLVDAENDPKRYGWPVTAYPDCVGCHVVGYGETSGFVSPTATPQLRNVGCEVCHGAGSEHVKTEGKAKLGIAGGVAPSVLCTRCHDFEQAPDFLYGDKWKLVVHACEPGQKSK